MTSVAVVLVTHDSHRYLSQTLESIAEQTSTPHILVAVDDHSQDNTTALLTQAGFEVHRATSGARDAATRIAHNFLQGLLLAQRLGADIAILGDHDDIWRKDRIAHQVAVLDSLSAAAMVASDGFLIDEHGAALPGTIRSRFPIPDDFSTWPVRRQMSYALRHSVATGGASAVRISGLPDWTVPAGWLHDRWWSLSALRRGRLVIDDYPVIDYRVSADQQVGLDTASQDAPSRWLLSKVRRTSESTRKVRDLGGLVRG